MRDALALLIVFGLGSVLGFLLLLEKLLTGGV